MACRNDFVVGQESSTQEYKDFISGLDSFKDIVDFQNKVDSRVDRKKVEYITSFINKVVKYPTVSLDAYPSLKDRVNVSANVIGDMNVVEISNFIVDRNYNEDSLIRTFVNSLPDTTINPNDSTYSINDGVDSVLRNLDDFLNTNVASVTTGDFCSTFANTFLKLGALYTLASAGASKIAELKNGTTTFLKNFDANVKTMIDMLKTRLENEINEHRKALARLKHLPRQLIDRGIAFVNSIEQHLSDLNIERLKGRTEEVIAKMGGQFEELTPEAIAYIMFRLCQMTHSIQEFMRNPIDNYKKFIRECQDTVRVINNEFKKQHYANYVNGGLRFDRDESLALKKLAYKNQAGGAGQDVRNGGTTASTRAVVSGASNELIEKATTFDIQRSGDRFSSVKNEFFELTSRAMNVGVDYNSQYMFPDTCGWTSVRSIVWAKAAMLSKRLGQRLIVSSAYRTPEKNMSVGGARTSFHMRGMALDIYVAGTGIDHYEFVKHANLVGFKGIGYYGTFIHVDVRPSLGMWIEGNASTDVERALNIHRFPETFGYFKDSYTPEFENTATPEFSIEMVKRAIDEA